MKARETLARKKAIVDSDIGESGDKGIVVSDAGESDNEGIVVPGTPPRPVGESQGGTTMTLAVRPSPEQARRIHLRPLVLAASSFVRLFPEVPPASTAPARLEEEGRGKRRRLHTDRYEVSKAQGDINELQYGK